MVQSVTLHTNLGELKVPLSLPPPSSLLCPAHLADPLAWQIEVFCETVPKTAEVPPLALLRPTSQLTPPPPARPG